MAADLSQYLDVPDALLQEQMPGVDIQALKESIRKSQAAKEGNVTPVTQTIKTDPVTGEQTMTVSGNVEDLSPVNPLAPTIQPGLQNRPPMSQPPQAPQPVAPVNPADAYNRYTQQMESGANPNIGYHNPEKSTAYGAYGITQPQYQEIQKQNPAFANRPIESLSPQEQGQANTTSRDVYAQQLRAKGVEPTEENLRMAHLLGAGGTSQYLKSGTFNPQSVAANGGEEQLRRMVEQRRQGPVAPGQQPPVMIAGNASSDVGLTPTEQAIRQQQLQQQQPVPQWHQAILSANGDPKKLATVMAGDYPDEAKAIAQNLIVQNSMDQKEKLDAQKKLQGFAQGDPNATRDVMKLIKQQSEEGSYVKAVLFSQLGLGELAKQEQAKIGGPVISKAMVGGQSYLTESRNGVVVGAYDPTGKRVDDATLARINAEATPQGTHAYGFTGGSIVIPQGQPNAGQEYRQRTNTITGQIENVITTGPNAGKLYTGSPGIERSVGTAALKLDYGVISKYREKFGTDALGALAQMQKDRGPMSREEQDAFLNSYGFQAGPPGVGGVPGQGAPAGAPMPAMPGGSAAGPVAPQRPPVPGQAPMPGQPAPGAPVRPVAPGQAPAMAQPAPISNIPGAGQPPVRGMNEPESTYNLRKDAWETQAKDIAQGEAKVKLALPQYESNADQILGTIGRVVGTGDKPAPGFEANVGVRNPLGVMQLRGTDARAWQAQYKQLMGQNFLSAFNDLKGAGAITDAEGKAATEARAALSDPGISEEDFRRNAKILEDTIKTGVNRQRALAGLPPKYDMSEAGASDVMNKADDILNKGKKKP